MAGVRGRPEDELLEAVIDMARMLGVYVAHFRPAQIRPGKWVTAVQADGKGYPDLTLVGPGGVAFRELKSQVGRVEPEQAVWLRKLAGAGADAGVWRPSDLHSGRIEKELRALRSVKETR